MRRTALLIGDLRQLPRGHPPARAGGAHRARVAELLRPLPPGAERPRPADHERRGPFPRRAAAGVRAGHGPVQRPRPRRRAAHRRRARGRRPADPRAGETTRGRRAAMTPGRVRDVERLAAARPETLALRLRLAAALRSEGRREEGTALVRSVAAAYHAEGRLAQALAVCRSLLELEPGDGATQ